MNTKQVIVINRALKMSRGKENAQCCHASMSFFARNLRESLVDGCFITERFTIEELGEIDHWLNHSFRKICVYVDSEEELVAIHEKALEAGLISHMIIDNGVTEFNNVPTRTVVALGPHKNGKFIGITDHLKLY